MGIENYDVELYDAVTDLVAEGKIEEGSAAHGIAKQAIDSGYHSLSPKQRGLYDAVVVPALRQRAKELAATHAMNRTD